MPDRFPIAKLVFLALLFSLQLIQGCSVNPVSGQANLALISEQQEIRIGRENHPKVLAQYHRYPDEALQKYISDIGQKLAMHSHRTNLIYRFTLLDSKEVNAFALPGGYIYITRGLLAYLNSEAELAAVLGHEIGHVTARHAVRQISAARAAQLGYQIGALFVPEMRTQGASQLFNILGSALISGYGREHELEADQLGVEYMEKSGYPSSAMLSVLGLLKDQETFEVQLAKEEHRKPHVYHGVFASHPDNDTRLQNVIQTQPSEDNLAAPQDLAFLERLKGLTFGEGAEEGVLRQNHFYHLDMNFSLEFPEGWHIQNQPDGLVATAPDGEASLTVTAEDLNLKISPLQFIHDRLHIRNMISPEPLLIHGLRAYTLQTSHKQGMQRLTVIFHQSKAFIITGVTKDPTLFSSHDHYFLKTSKSFHSLSKDERVLANARKLDLVKADSTHAIEDLAISSQLGPHAKEILELLNHLYPGKSPQVGQWLKTVR
ncbi:MAG: peptidase [Gammaproteobacteria bacterium]|nr:MAG: peptidase [Gammaproteobacteria bacterium]